MENLTKLFSTSLSFLGDACATRKDIDKDQQLAIAADLHEAIENKRVAPETPAAEQNLFAPSPSSIVTPENAAVAPSPGFPGAITPLERMQSELLDELRLLKKQSESDRELIKRQQRRHYRLQEQW